MVNCTRLDRQADGFDKTTRVHRYYGILKIWIKWLNRKNNNHLSQFFFFFSGLDSFTSFQLMEHVKQLSQSRVVVCVVHQPNSQLLELFDDIMVLANGQNLYSGPLDQLVPYLAEAGFTCPSFYNRADFGKQIIYSWTWFLFQFSQRKV